MDYICKIDDIATHMHVIIVFVYTFDKLATIVSYTIYCISVKLKFIIYNNIVN